MNRDEAQISLMSWNINGLKKQKTKKKKYVADITDVQKIFQEDDIVFLQETHIGPNDRDVLKKLVEWRPFFTAHDPRSKGVAILIKKDYAHEIIESHEDSYGRYIIVKCIILGQVYTLVNVYNHKSERDTLDEFIPYLQESAEGVLVIGGDFNTTLNPYLDRTPTQTQDHHAASRRCVEKFTASLGLVDVWRRINPTVKKYTYSQNNSKSRLDYIFIQEESIWRVKTCEILDTPEKYSDHKPVRLQLTSKPSSRGPLPKTNEEKKEGILNKKGDSSLGDDRILIVDIPWAARSLPNSKPPGPDGIPVHFYKSNCSHLPCYFNVLYNQMLHNKMGDAPNQVYFNHSIESLDDRSYCFFNVDYLILATILAWHLERLFKLMTAQTEMKRKKIKSLIVIQLGERTVNWSLLEQALTEACDSIFVIIVGKLLRSSDQDQKQEFIQLRRGCPLTTALLKLYVSHIARKKINPEFLQSGETLGHLIYSETVMISLSFHPEARVQNKFRKLGIQPEQILLI